jgi:Hypervirulence associated proteins TUDOR domain
MSKDLHKGDTVSWESSGGHSTGKVVKKLTSPMTIKGHKVAASKDNPEYLVETDDGKQAAHKPDALKRI